MYLIDTYSACLTSATHPSSSSSAPSSSSTRLSMGRGGKSTGAGTAKGETVDLGFVQMSVPDLLKWVMDSAGSGSPSPRSEVDLT